MIDSRIKFKKKWMDNKGVSEIIGTILMLAITVVLFSSIMVFVTNMPTPIERPTADFLSSVTYATTPTKSGTVTLTHNGGEALNDYETQILVIVNGNILSAPRTIAEGGLGSTWKIGEKWKYTIPGLEATNSLEIMVVDLHSNSQVWDGKISAGQGNNAPVILQRWTDSDPNTLTVDSIIEGDSYFWLYVRVTDLDSDIQSVVINAASIGASSSKTYNTLSEGVWGYNFTTPITQASLFDGKPLFIIAKDNANHWTNATFILAVSASERGPQGATGPQGPQGPASGQDQFGDEGLPSYLYYVHGDQGYVVLGENKTAPRTWGALANTSDRRFNFTYGEGWVFIRIGTRLVKNLDSTNTIEFRNIFSTNLVSPPSSTTAFALKTVSGTVYIYEYKFNTSSLSPGAFAVHIDLESSAVEGASPGQFAADFQILISPPAGQTVPFIPTVTTYKDSARTLTWGTKDQPFDLSSIDTSYVYMEVKMQDVGTAASCSVQEVRISDMRSRSNLYGSPPTGDLMIGSINVDSSRKTYYWAVDLRLRNGMTYTAGLSAYTLKITGLFDSNEGVYTLTNPLWIRSAVATMDFVVSTDGYGFGKATGGDTFLHQDYIIQYDNNKFFTSRVLHGADGDPGAKGMSFYKALFFDIDGDGDRDVLAAYTDVTKGSGGGSTYRVGVFINRLNEYGIWEPRSIFTNYTTTGNKILSMAYGDVDGDGDPDWVISQDGGTVFLYINDFPIRTRTLFTGMYFQEMRLQDINLDGKADLIGIGHTASVVRGDANSKVWTYNLNVNKTSGVMTTNPKQLTALLSNSVQDFDMANIDSSGGLDIAVATASATDGVSWFRWGQTWNNASITSDPSPPANGTILSGSYSDTTSKGGNSEQLREDVGGRLNFTWMVATVGGSNSVLTVTARCEAGSTEGFYFYYSTAAGGPYTFMFSLSNSASSFTDYQFQLPARVSGTIYLRAVDSVTTPGDSTRDSLFIDYVRVVSVNTISYTKIVLNNDATHQTFTSIGIGNDDNTGYLDIFVGKSGQINIIRLRSSDGMPLGGDIVGSLGYWANLRPSGDMFEIKDANGDGLADIVTAALSPAATAAGTTLTGAIYYLMNLGPPTQTFSFVLVSDLYASYGNKGDQVMNQINCENMYG